MSERNWHGRAFTSLCSLVSFILLCFTAIILYIEPLNGSFLLDFGFIEAERIGYDRNTAEGHGQGGQDGMQLAKENRQGFKGIQDSGRHRN